MVAEVGLMVRSVEGSRTAGPELVTRDFLGGCNAGDAKDAAAPQLERRDLAVKPSKAPAVQKHACPLQDLALFPVAAPTKPQAPSQPYHSVCTIEKVKSALERFERQSQSGRPSADGSPSSSSVTTSSVKRRGDDAAVEQGDGCESAAGGMVAAACSRCLLYVLISKGDPRCPRCEAHVPAPLFSKKPRIDLNV